MDIKKLKELRIQLGITIKELAKWLNFSASFINGCETGRTKPTSDFLFNYEQFLQDVIDGKINPRRSFSAGRVYKKKMPKVGDIFNYKSKTIDFIEAFNLNFNLGNVIKYVSNAHLEDLRKARWYLNSEIKRLSNEKERINDEKQLRLF